jgi:CubicO group peptidase (beta-lactamase class C family)
MRRLVFEPLGMNHSTYDCDAVPAGALALPHDEAGAPRLTNGLARNAAGSLHTTAGDYARFLQATLNGEGLAAETIGEMLRPASRPPVPFLAALDPTGRPPLAAGVAWGLGWGLEPARETIFHWGSNPNFKAFTLASPKDGLGFVVLSAGETELSLGPALAAALFPGARPSLAWFGVSPP